MKKTYFDLKKEEKKEYKVEFHQTERGKQFFKFNKFLIGSLIVLFFLGILWVFIGEIVAEEKLGLTQARDIESMVLYGEKLLESIFVSILSFGVLFNFYVHLCFISWLKHKHKILKW